MFTTQTHQHESQHRERGHEEQKHRRDEKDGGRHGHDHHHHRRQWFNVNAEQRDIIIMILGGVIALVFVLLFVF